MKVVDELRIPAGRDVLGVDHLGEDEGGLMGRAAHAGGRAAAVEIPVPQAEDDDVAEPDGTAAGEQDIGVGAEFRRADDPGHQTHRGAGVHGGDQADQRAGQYPEPSRFAVDAARIADDQYGQEDDDDHDEGPAGVAVPELRWQGGAEASGGQHGHGHGPAALAGPGRDLD
jgi:hypothetical protein